MKDAKSIYLGGDIVAAEDCDYESYRSLGLTCPFCNEAVFLRTAFFRKGVEKDTEVNPHFVHFPSSLAKNGADCERRSLSKEGRAEIERIKVEARNQRLKLYNDRLWDMFSIGMGKHEVDLVQDRRSFSHSLTYKEIEHISSINAKIYKIFSKKWADNGCRKAHQELRENLDFWLGELENILNWDYGDDGNDEARRKITIPVEAADEISSESSFSSAFYRFKHQFVKPYESLINSEFVLKDSSIRKQRELCREVVSFLATGHGFSVFSKLCKTCIVKDIAPKGSKTKEDCIEWLRDGGSEPAEFCMSAVSAIATVPWDTLVRVYQTNQVASVVEKEWLQLKQQWALNFPLLPTNGESGDLWTGSDNRSETNFQGTFNQLLGVCIPWEQEDLIRFLCSMYEVVLVEDRDDESVGFSLQHGAIDY